MPIELKPEWIIHNEDGTEGVNPYPVLDELSLSIKALQSIATGKLNDHPASKSDTILVMRLIAADALKKLGLWPPPNEASESRCPVCNWPMVATVKEGCVPGNCSYRGGIPVQKPVLA